MAVVTKTRTYNTGDTVTASYYNADRDEVIAGVNSIVNAQISNSAAIDKSKISGTAVTLTSQRVVTVVSDGTTVTFDGALGNNFAVTIAGTRTAAASMSAGQYIAIYVTQGGTGSYSFTGTWWTTTIKWADAVAPTFTTTVGKTDVFVVFYDGSSYFGFVAAQNM